MLSPLPRTRRRTALGGTAALVLSAAGCSSLPSLSEPTGPSTTSDGEGATGVPDDVDPDVALVTSTLEHLATARHLVRENRRAHPDLAPILRPLERLHRAHALELGELVELSTTVADATQGRARVIARVSAAERRLERRLVRSATAAESGALAQLLASMAAAVTQARSLL